MPDSAIDSGSSGWDRVARGLPILLYLLLANALLLCLAHYLTFRGLWLDEAFIACNLKYRDLPGLFGPLEYGQQFPRLYLALISLLTQILGYKIEVLRLLPFLFAVGGVVLWFRIYQEAFRSRPQAPFVRLGAFLLFVTTTFLYYYAGELKQYSADLFWSGFAFWFAQRYVAPATHKGLRVWLGTTLVWLLPCLLSLTYIFVAAAVAAAVVFPALRQTPHHRTWKLVSALSLSAVMAACVYAVDLRHARDDTLQAYWSDYFIQGATLSAWGTSLYQGCAQLIGRWWTGPSTPFFTLLGFVGVYSVIRNLKNDNSLLLARAGCFLGLELLVLGALQQYPLACGRTSLFFFPYAVALVMAGVLTWFEARHRGWRWAGGVSLGLVIFLGLAWKIPTLSRQFYRYHHPEDLNAAMVHLANHPSALVLYGRGSRAQVEAFPQRPEQITYRSDEPLFATSPGEQQAMLGNRFYYLYSYPNGDYEAAQERLAPFYSSRPIVPHLYLFERTSAP